MAELTLEELCNEPLAAKDNQAATPEPSDTGKDNLADAHQKEVSTPVVPDGQGTQTEAEVTPYTPEELKTIPLERLESNRIPDNVRPFYDKALDEKKSLQAGFTQKAQELAEYRRRMESGQQTQTIEDMFDRNPIETMKRINAEISNRRLALADVDPIMSPDDDKALRREMARLENLKEELNQRAIDNRMQQVAQEEARVRLESIVSDTVAVVKSEFKDYDTRRSEVEKFAMSQGYTEQELGVLTDPRIVGKDMAIKNFRIMNTLYEKHNAGRTADDKLVKKRPNQLERDNAQSGVGGKKADLESYDDLDKYLTAKKL